MKQAHKHIFQTSVGEIWIWGDSETLPTGQPLVLFINGAFSIPRPRSYDLPDLLPAATVMNGHLPGNHCPRLNAHGVSDRINPEPTQTDTNALPSAERPKARSSGTVMDG